MSAYATVHFKTTIKQQNIKIILIAGVPSSQALLGFLITAPASVCVPDVIGVLSVWIQNQKKQKRDSWTNQNSGSKKNKVRGSVVLINQKKNGRRHWPTGQWSQDLERPPHLINKWALPFGWVVLALFKTSKADQENCENSRRLSSAEFHKTSPMCRRGEGRNRPNQSIVYVPLQVDRFQKSNLFIV